MFSFGKTIDPRFPIRAALGLMQLIAHVEQSVGLPVVSNTAHCIRDVDVTVDARARCLRFVRSLYLTYRSITLLFYR